jgi:hypothetical protein
MAMGIKGFIMKPVATGDLAAMVRIVLDEAPDSTFTPIRPTGNGNSEGA